MNWALEPKAFWNHVKEVARSFEVRLGVEDNKCGFSFATEIILADLVLVFGPNVTFLDVNNQMCSGKTSLLLKTSRLLLVLLVFVRTFLHGSFADQSADDASTNVPNVAQVTFLFWPIARRYRYLTYTGAMQSLVSFPHRSFADVR